MRILSFAYILISCIIYFSCRQETSLYTTLSGNAQGTTFQITYKDSLQRDFSPQVDSLFRIIDYSMSLWDSNSIISKINRNDTVVRVDEHFERVFIRSMEISKLTDGAFDMTVGQLIQTWKRKLKEGSEPPDSLSIKQLLDITGYQKIRLVDNHVIKSVPEIQIDLNGIAQGYTVDVMATYLYNQGVNDFLVEIGGELRAAGKNLRGTLWQVGIDKPIDSLIDGRPLQATLALDNQALATSGSYRNYLEKVGKKFNHIINPITGYPVDHHVVSVSVIAADCMTADALATAFMVMSMDQALKVADREKVELYIIYRDEKGNLTEKATPGFLK